ncbi:hypothetical protein IFM89_037913 [Coptis chinensis]|uniref:Uncharacterized protein n=1 Tax=Coptis chinensis TaxID=261450 RepID=A0A835M8H9_9MAGN|nr:hypothetical protein IFM89_037913 [Coptis chinensis]
MSSKQGGKAKPLKQPKADKKEYDEKLDSRHEKHYRYVSTHDVAYWSWSFM